MAGRGRPKRTREQEKAMWANMMRRLGAGRKALGPAKQRVQFRVGEGLLTGYQAGAIKGKHAQQLVDNPYMASMLGVVGAATGTEVGVAVGRAMAGGLVGAASTIKGGIHGMKEYAHRDLPYDKLAVERAVGVKRPKVIKRGEVKFPATKKQREQQRYHTKLMEPTAGRQLAVSTLFGSYTKGTIGVSAKTRQKFVDIPTYDPAGNVVNMTRVPKTPAQLAQLSSADLRKVLGVVEHPGEFAKKIRARKRAQAKRRYKKK